MARANFRRLEADVRRQSLIDATAHCLARHGAKVSVRMICAEAGVSAGLLRHYFEGVDDLIAATYLDIGEMMGRTMQQAAEAAGPDPRAQLRAYVLASFRPPIMDPQLLATWLAFWSLINSDGRIKDLHREIYESYRKPAEALIARVLGVSPELPEVRMQAVAITALVDGMWLELCLDPTSFSPEEAELIATQWLDRLMSAPSAKRVAAE